MKRRKSALCYDTVVTSVLFSIQIYFFSYINDFHSGNVILNLSSSLGIGLDSPIIC